MKRLLVKLQRRNESRVRKKGREGRILQKLRARKMEEDGDT